MSLTADEIVKYTAYLNSAEAAYNSLMIGGQAVEFTDQNGERIRYSSANAPRLYSYINWLRQVLGMCPFMGGTSAPAGVIF